MSSALEMPTERSSLVVRALPLARIPRESRSKATASVNVPPVSMPMMMRAAMDAPSFRCGAAKRPLPGMIRIMVAHGRGEWKRRGAREAGAAVVREASS